MINAHTYLVDNPASPQDYARAYAYLLKAPNGGLWATGWPEVEQALTRPKLPPPPDMLGSVRAKAADQDAQRQKRLTAMLSERPAAYRQKAAPPRPPWLTPAPLPTARQRARALYRPADIGKPTRERLRAAITPA